MKPYARSREPGAPLTPAEIAANQMAGIIAARPDSMSDLDGHDAREPGAEIKPMSVIGADITITGNIEASVDLHIEGRVKGDVRCATLILGENSVVNGSIYADRVRVSGSVEGSVETKDLAVEATARVMGDITYARLRVANGGVIEGQIKCRPSEETGGDSAKLKLVEPKTEPRAEVRTEPQIDAVFID